MTAILRDFIKRNRQGEACAIPSVCSAHPDVLRASLMLAEELDQPVVIEATSNQVNQFGGYTGMRPADFVAMVFRIADENGVDRARITLGGDHLGPQAWRSESADVAMGKAHEMISEYIAAGFRKIHLDCSEGCAGEATQVDDALSAARAAELAETCEKAGAGDDLLLVIGTEVPPPGGARPEDGDHCVPTEPEAALATLAAHKSAFDAQGVGHLWQAVGGLVVQPGVEFGASEIDHFNADRATPLARALKDEPQICFEAHSTDYQRTTAYKELAKAGFAFQKIGPALTFAYRQALYSLDLLLAASGQTRKETIMQVMEQAMLDNPKFWQSHYQADDAEALKQLRHFSYADRIRYYWPDAAVQKGVASLFADLENKPLPTPLLLQTFDAKVIDRAESMKAKFGTMPKALVAAEIQEMLRPYFVGA